MPIGRNSRRNVSKARRAVFERDGYTCITGGILGPLGACQGVLTVQHRVGRGMGGSALFDTPAHLVSMCAMHNTLETHNRDVRELYERLGWSVPRWVMREWSIEEVPVCYLDGWALLDGEGKVSLTSEKARERMGAIYGGLPTRLRY